jgi:ribosomal protein S18 acetylase RimI-like enzyme
MVKYKRLKRAKISEIKPLWEMLNAMHAETSRDFGQVYRDLSFEQGMGNLARLVEDDIYILTAQTGDGKIVGYIVAFSSEGRGEIDSLFVDLGFRHQGIGRRLCEVAMDWMRERECRSMVVALSVGNEKALPFYQSLGFCQRLVYLQHKA